MVAEELPVLLVERVPGRWSLGAAEDVVVPSGGGEVHELLGATDEGAVGAAEEAGANLGAGLAPAVALALPATLGGIPGVAEGLAPGGAVVALRLGVVGRGAFARVLQELVELSRGRQAIGIPGSEHGRGGRGGGRRGRHEEEGARLGDEGAPQLPLLGVSSQAAFPSSANLVGPPAAELLEASERLLVLALEGAGCANLVAGVGGGERGEPEPRPLSLATVDGGRRALGGLREAPRKEGNGVRGPQRVECLNVPVGEGCVPRLLGGIEDGGCELLLLGARKVPGGVRDLPWAHPLEDFLVAPAPVEEGSEGAVGREDRVLLGPAPAKRR